jgi:hypothetical protein
MSAPVESAVPESASIDSSEPVAATVQHPPAQRPRPGLVLRQQIFIVIGLVMALFVGFAVGRVAFPKASSNMERFWQPITSAPGRITYCLGEPVDATDRARLNLSQGMGLNGGMDVSDVITLARSIVPLAPRHDAFRVVSASQTPFAELRESPFVLIGAFDNIWTMRITQDLPFGFEVDDKDRKIVDRKSPHPRFWTLQWEVPYTKLAKDYAIVARIHDNVTGQPVIILGGILGEGTEAASEVVSNPAYMDAMLKKAPKNWAQLDLEAVIETNVIDGKPGPPNILAVEAW